MQTSFMNLAAYAAIGAAIGLVGCERPASDHTEPSTSSVTPTGHQSHQRESQESALRGYAVDPGDPSSKRISSEIAVMIPTKGNHVTGTVRFTKVADGLEVDAQISGLPRGEHAYHVHLYGDCSADDGKSAGTHFNFKGSSQNPPQDIRRITGNLGVLEADQSGKASDKHVVRGAELAGPYSILGRAVIIHELGNDPSSPPIGAAGSRLACGVIGAAPSGHDS